MDSAGTDLAQAQTLQDLQRIMVGFQEQQGHLIKRLGHVEEQDTLRKERDARQVERDARWEECVVRAEGCALRSEERAAAAEAENRELRAALITASVQKTLTVQTAPRITLQEKFGGKRQSFRSFLNQCRRVQASAYHL
ncbi:hypothetical protein FKM82_028938 [Ascaphus truei]